MKRADATSTDSSPRQLKDPRLLIRASAGTGKTFQLSSRYIALLRQTSPERILSSTFTRKAAGEILERILLRLARATNSTGSLKELGQSIEAPDLSRQECLQMLVTFTRQLHRVRICTLDAFFSQLAGSHALELGFPSGWRILDQVEVGQLHAQALEQMLREGDQQELVQLMHMLDKGDSSRSVSGLMHQTIENLYQVFIDSSPAAWDQFPNHHFLLDDQREELLQAMERHPVPQTRMQTAVAKDCAAARDERWDDFLKKGLLPKIRSGDPTYYKVPIPGELCALYEQLSEHALALTAASWKQQTQAAWRLLDDFQRTLERLKQAAGGLEFGDITRRLSAGPGMEQLQQMAFRMDSAIEHLLLDEFQDTSRPQWEVIRGFADEACRTPGRTFFCVGDVKQAIYGWRGGEAAIFDTIEQQLPDLTTQPLNLSYRSSPVVIEAVNEIMTRLLQHDNLEDHAELLHRWCRSFPRHETNRKNLSGYVCLRTGPEVPESEDGRASTREQREAFWKFSAQYVADLARKSPHATLGVLTRGNAAVGRMIFELSRLGVPASEEGGTPLTDAAGVQLVLSLMKLADHPGDTVAAFHVIRSPLGAALGIDAADPQQMTAFARELRGRLLHQGYGGVIHDLALQLAGVCHRREYRRLQQLATLGDRYDSLFSSLRPGEFVHYVETQRCEEPSNSKIRVMTVHQSKGLEFDCVVLPDLEAPLMLPPRYVTRSATPGTAPDLVALYRSEEYFESLGGELLQARRETRDRMVQEALCLLYVALTRSARSLHLLIPPTVRAHHPKSFAGLLRAALAPDRPLKPMELLWEQGDPDWSAGMHVDPAPAPPSSAPPLQFAPSRRATPRQGSSPSGQNRKSAVRLADMLKGSGFTGADRGTLFHRWLQEIHWLDDSPIPEQRFRRLAGLSGLSEKEIEHCFQQFWKVLQRPELRSSLQREAYSGLLKELCRRHSTALEDLSLDVRTEVPFIHEVSAGETIGGKIDRLILISRLGKPIAAEIIDFKTDVAATPEDVKRLENLYEGQLAAYRAAVAILWNLPPAAVTSRLLFL